jgi:hypothetical protein
MSRSSTSIFPPLQYVYVCVFERERSVIFFTLLLAFIRLYHRRNSYIRQLKVINIVGYQDASKAGKQNFNTIKSEINTQGVVTVTRI